jgi:hypothetical protein
MWEYKVEYIGDHSTHAPLEDHLNQLGAEGWELIGLFYRNAYFKRKKNNG